jgi:RNA polymerase sigma-70 factor (ECF subfamily)
MAANFSGEVDDLDKSEFAQKIFQMEQSLYHVSKTILLNETDCEDAVSEAILKAYLKLDTLKEERFFKTWVTKILINECYRKLRERKRVVCWEDEWLDQTEAEQQEDYSDLYRSIMALKPNIRIAIELYYIEGYSIEEIKNILKIPSGTVKSRLAKGRKLLKSKLIEAEV